MHLTINTLTKKVIIHDLTLTKTGLVVKMLQAIGEDANNYQICDKMSIISEIFSDNYKQPLKNLTNPDDK